jgi:N-hydroxyarylamine O-acetyltransferase
VIDALLAHIGLPGGVRADREGLFAIHRAYLEHVPYEDIAVQLGETGPLDFETLAERVLSGRGGYCFELNTVLAGLLRAVGFSVTHHQSVVGGSGETNHMALVVGGAWIADAGLGEGFLDPLPLREGANTIGPFTYSLEREPAGTWWMRQHQWGSVNGFRMQPEPSTLADFEPHHRRLATDPASSFVQTLVVQKPERDRIITLRSRTLSSIGPTVNSKHVIADLPEFSSVLDTFGITLDGERLERLWDAARTQHEAFLARRAGEPSHVVPSPGGTRLAAHEVES